MSSSLHQDAIKNDYFTNPDGLKLFEQIWFTENENTRAFVFIIHGLSEHSSFYYDDVIAKPLNKIGCVVAAHDHTGHGRSEGNRSVIETIEKLTRDVIVHIVHIREKLNIPDEIPTFLYGHSMGGLIACMICLERPDLIKGMILESPALTLNGRNDTGPVSMFFLRILSYYMPSYLLNKPNFQNLTRNQDVIKDALEDTYRNKNGMTMGTAIKLGDSINSIQSQLKNITIPFLVAHGNKDVVISSTGSRHLTDVAAVKDKLFIEYDGVYHMARIDTNEIQEDFKSKFVKWINDRI